MSNLVRLNQSGSIVHPESMSHNNRIAIRYDSEDTQAVLPRVPTMETPASKELHALGVAYQEAQGEVGRNRVLNPQGRWKRLSDAIQKAAEHPENQAELKHASTDFKGLIHEHYRIARSECNILAPDWLSRGIWNITGGGFSGTNAEKQEHIAVLRESIEATIKELQEIDSDKFKSEIANYKSLLAKLPQSSVSVTNKHREQYWKSLTERHPTKAPENWFSHETASALGTFARLAMLSPVSQHTRDQPGIGARVNAEFQTRASKQRSAAPQSDIVTPVQGLIQDLGTGLGLRGETDVCYDLPALSQELAVKVDAARPALESYQAVSEDVVREFGNKEANLVRQRRLLEALQVPGVEVPRSEGFTTSQVREFLADVEPEALKHWDALKSEATLTPRARELLAEIDEALERAFSRTDAFERLNATPEMRAWLQKLEKDGRFLMVRSTGAEDTKENANAGGNLSEAYIPATQQAVAKSVGNVVRSYFAERSLQNRLNAGRNPFAEELRLSVTMQELIGEPPGGADEFKQIPRSLVMFTNEPLFVGGEEFRVTRLSATYGHGEGVVGNQGIATDTIMVLHSVAHPDQLTIIYDNQAKPTRLAPIREPNGRVTLQQLDNPVELRSRRVFSEQEIARLFQWGLVAESYFGGPTDMEIVVRGDTIYPVQARPVNRQALLPSYIDPAKIAGLPSMRAEAFVPGRGSVLDITDKSQVLIAPTLEEAERAFDKEKHRLVVVSEREPANSHPVVNFSSLGITCVAVSPQRQEQLQDWLGQLDQHSIAVCPQSGSLYLAAKEGVQELTTSGFVAHPAQTRVSFDLPEPLAVSLTRIEQAPAEVEELVMAVNTAATTEQALAHLARIEQHDWVQNLRKSREKLEQRLASMREKPQEAVKILEAAKQLEAQIARTLEEAKASLEKPGRLRALLQTRILNTLLCEPQSEGVNQFSVASMNAALAAAQEIASYQEALGEKPAKFADMLLEGQRTPDSSVYALWKSFLSKLEALPPEQTATFREMIADLKASGEMALWMTLFFRQGYDGQDVPKALDSFKAQFPESDKAPAKAMIRQIEDTRRLRTQLADFGDPEKIPAAFKRLKEMSESLSAASLGSSGGAVLNSIRLKLMDEFVDLYDSAIKAMKVSQKYSDQEKAGIFQEMLEPYTAMMEDWVQNLAGDKLIPSEMGIVLWPVNTYLKWFRENFAKKIATPAELQASREFSVAAAKLGTASAAAAFDRHYPQTLEDYFTLAHQNLLAVIGHMNIADSGLRALGQGELKSLGGMMESIEKLSVGSGENQYRPVRIGSKISEDSIVVQYRVPLRNHAAGLELVYHKESGKAELKVSFLGEARARWGQIRFLAETFGASGIRSNAQGLEYALQVDSSSIGRVLEEFKFATDITFSDGQSVEKILDFASKNGRSPKIIIDSALKMIVQNDESTCAAGLQIIESRIAKHELNPKQIAQVSSASIALLSRPSLASDQMGAPIRTLVAIAQEKQDFHSLLELSKTLPIVSSRLLLRELIPLGVGKKEVLQSLRNLDKGVEGQNYDALSDLMGGILRSKDLIPDVVSLASEMTRSQELAVQLRGLQILDYLALQSRHSFIAPEASKVSLKICAESEEDELQIAALKVFKSLLIQGTPAATIVEDAASAAIRLATNSANPDVQNMAIEVLQRVVSNSKHTLKIANVATNLAKDPDPRVQKAVIGLCSSLWYHDAAKQKVIDAFLTLSEDPHETIEHSLAELAIRISERQDDFKKISDVVQKLAGSKDLGPNYRYQISKILLEYDMASKEQIVELLRDALEPGSSDINLIGLLVRKGHASDVLIKSIKERILDERAAERLNLVSILIENGLVDDETFNAALKLTEGEHSVYERISMLSKMLDKGIQMPALTQAVLKVVQDPKIEDCRWKPLLDKLIEKTPPSQELVDALAQIDSLGKLETRALATHQGTLEFARLLANSSVKSEELTLTIRIFLIRAFHSIRKSHEHWMSARIRGVFGGEAYDSTDILNALEICEILRAHISKGSSLYLSIESLLNNNNPKIVQKAQELLAKIEKERSIGST